MKFIVTTSETVARLCKWEVHARNEDEAREKFNNGERRLVDDEDVDTIDMTIESVKPGERT